MMMNVRSVLVATVASLFIYATPCSADEQSAFGGVADVSFLFADDEKRRSDGNDDGRPKEAQREQQRDPGFFSVSPFPRFSNDALLPNRSYGVAFVGPIMAQALLTGAGFSSIDETNDGGVGRAPAEEVALSSVFLADSSPRHVDALDRTSGDGGVGGDGGDARRPASSRVAIVPLATNPHAHFETEGACHPIVRGHMIHFDGLSPHGTVLRRGAGGDARGVSLIGPIHLPAFVPTGDVETPPSKSSKTTKASKKGRKY